MRPAITFAHMATPTSALWRPRRRGRIITTWRMRHALRGVAVDGLAVRRVTTVAFGAFVASCPRPVVVEEVTDVDKAASRFSAVLMAEASR